MLEMLMKQILGDIDMDAVKDQIQQFAKMISEIHANSVASRDALLRLERLVKSQTAQEGSLLDDKGMRNGNDNHDQLDPGNGNSGPG